MLYRIFLLIIACCLVLVAPVVAESKNVPVISLTGFVGKDQVKAAKEIVESLPQAPQQKIAIEISSNSGDLDQVLDLAKLLYEKKVRTHLEVIVFIEDNALGPVAVIPLLADQLYISLYVSWGDVLLSVVNPLPANVLRARIESFILETQPQAQLLRLLAGAMVDPSMTIIDEGGWKLGTPASTVPQIKVRGETLVLNQNQLQELKLVSGILTTQTFHEKYPLSHLKEKDFTKVPDVSSGKLEKRLEDHIHFSVKGPNTVGHILIDDRTNGITQATWLYVNKALEHYKKTKPLFIILELNTPGGEVLAAQQISDALKEMDTQFNIPVVCFINNWAISAGAMLAYSCRFISVVKDGSMGAAEPVYQGEAGTMVTASEKVNSALRTDFANRAAFFDRNPFIAEAMVDKDLLIVLRNNEILKLDSDSQIHSTPPNPDEVISPKGKLLTLTSEQMMRLGVADLLLLPEKLPPITEQEQQKGQWPASKMLLFQQPFFKSIPDSIVESYQMDWKMRFFALLASPAVASMLMLGLMVGGYLEFSTPGFGVGGTVAVTCLILIIMSSYALEIANTLEIVLLLVGVLIIIVDLFFLPTFGLLGSIGALFFLAGLIGLMLPGLESVHYEIDTNSFNAAGQAVFERLVWFSGAIVASLLIILVLTWYIKPSMKAFSRLVLTGQEQVGYIAGDDPKLLPQPGMEGEAATTLRPAGKVIIENQLYDAITRGGFIDKGEAIKVDHLDGSVIVVVKTKERGIL